MIMDKAQTSNDLDLGTKVSFSTLVFVLHDSSAEQKNKDASHVLLQYSWTLQKTTLLDPQMWSTTLTMHPSYDLQLE